METVKKAWSVWKVHEAGSELERKEELKIKNQINEALWQVTNSVQHKLTINTIVS